MKLIAKIAGRPVPQARAQTTVNGTFYPKASREYREDVKWMVTRRARELGWPMQYKGKVELQMVISLTTPARRGDATNYAKQVEDAIQGKTLAKGAGLIVDDNQVVAPAPLVLNGQAEDFLWLCLKPISDEALLDRATQWMLEAENEQV